MAPIYEQLVRQLHLIAGDSVEQPDVEAFFCWRRASSFGERLL
jgi:hypothetical protein